MASYWYVKSGLNNGLVSNGWQAITWINDDQTALRMWKPGVKPHSVIVIIGSENGPFGPNPLPEPITISFQLVLQN